MAVLEQLRRNRSQGRRQLRYAFHIAMQAVLMLTQDAYATDIHCRLQQ
jgi:hypothetical protein